MTQAPGLRRAVERGKRVFLRRPSAGDEAEFWQLRTVSAEFLRRWEPRGNDTPAGRREGFKKLLSANRTGSSRKLLVCALDDGRILGYIALNEIIRGVFLSSYLSYWVGAPYAGQGYMTEALELVLRHAFGPLGLHRVEANIIPHNRPSTRLVRNAGFRKEGLSRRYLKIAGRWQDHQRWALLFEEYKARGRR